MAVAIYTGRSAVMRRSKLDSNEQPSENTAFDGLTCGAFKMQQLRRVDSAFVAALQLKQGQKLRLLARLRGPKPSRDPTTACGLRGEERQGQATDTVDRALTG